MVQKSKDTDKGAAALELAEELRWPVFPCWWVEDGRCACGDPNCTNQGKHPIGTMAPRGLKSATVDPEIIRKWWKKYPKANVAVRTGKDLWVLDLDGIDGIRAFSEIANNHPDLPEVPMARTGGGGRHLFFSPDPKVKNAAKIGGDPIDTRGQGGYIIVEPSDHASGNAYAWELPATKYDLEPAPPWLISYVTGGNGAAKDNGKSGLKFTFDEGDLASHPGAKEGERNQVLCRLAGAYLASGGKIDDLIPLAVAWGSRCKPPYPEKDVTRTVTKLASKHVSEKVEKQAAPKDALMVCYDTIDPQQVEWLWQDRFGLGKLTIVSGDPGLGKTYMLLDVTARVSAGRDFPDGAPCKKAKVIFATVEDGPGDTIRPRLDLLGADVTNVLHFEGIQDGEGKILPFVLDQHVPVLDRYLDENDGVRLIVIDPISGFLGDVDSHRNAEVRGVLAPLVKLAEKHGIAVVGINHLTKSQGKALYRSLGSLAFIAAARAAWAVVADPDDDERRLFLPVKNNLGKAAGLAYRIVEGKIEWENGPVLIGIDDLIEDADTPRDEAKEWLRGILADGPVEAKAVLKQAKQDGICERTLRTAKKELKIKSSRSGGSQGSWAWSLPGEEKSDGTYTF